MIEAYSGPQRVVCVVPLHRVRVPFVWCWTDIFQRISIVFGRNSSLNVGQAGVQRDNFLVSNGLRNREELTNSSASFPLFNTTISSPANESLNIGPEISLLVTKARQKSDNMYTVMTQKAFKILPCLLSRNLESMSNKRMGWWARRKFSSLLAPSKDKPHCE